MTLIDQLISEKIATNEWHARRMLEVLHCHSLPDEAARLARCRLYHQHKQSGENKAEARRKAIAGEPVLELPLDKNCQEF